MTFSGIEIHEKEKLASAVMPNQVIAWRDHLVAEELANNSICRKLTAHRSLFSYMQSYGFVGAGPAHNTTLWPPPRCRGTVRPLPCRARTAGQCLTHPRPILR